MTRDLFDLPQDEGLRAVAVELGVGPMDLLGHGGEAWVFALPGDRVARVCHDGVDRPAIDARHALLDELDRNAVPFALPIVLETSTIAGRVVVIEQRLPGESMLNALPHHDPALVAAHLDATLAIRALGVTRPWWGEISDDRFRRPSYREWALARAEFGLLGAGPDFAHLDAADLVAALPEPDAPAFVHLDAFTGNMLTDGQTVTAVIDFGPTACIADARLEPLTAAAYLDEGITPTATDDHRAVAHRWLHDHDLLDHLGPVRRWIAAYWSCFDDDVALHRWCRSVLLGD